jgi:hypothetical protein
VNAASKKVKINHSNTFIQCNRKFKMNRKRHCRLLVTRLIIALCLLCITASHCAETTKSLPSNEQLVDRLIDRVLQHLPNSQLKQHVLHLNGTRDRVALARLAVKLQSKNRSKETDSVQLDQWLEQSVRLGSSDQADAAWSRLMKRWPKSKRIKDRPTSNSSSLSTLKKTERFELGSLPLAEGFAAVLLGKLIGMKAGYLAGKMHTSTCPTVMEEEILVTEDEIPDETARDEMLPEDESINYESSLSGQGGSARRRGRKRRRKVIRVHHDGNVRTIHIYRRRRRPVNQMNVSALEPIDRTLPPLMSPPPPPPLSTNPHYHPSLSSPLPSSYPSSPGFSATKNGWYGANGSQDLAARRSIQRILSGQYEHSP